MILLPETLKIPRRPRQSDARTGPVGGIRAGTTGRTVNVIDGGAPDRRARLQTGLQAMLEVALDVSR